MRLFMTDQDGLLFMGRPDPATLPDARDGYLFSSDGL